MMETTPNTLNYMILGYALTFIVMGIYIFSLYLRNKNLKQDLETLESLKPKKAKKK